MLAFLMMMLLPNVLFLQISLAQKSPLNITTDTSALVVLRDHLLTTSDAVNNILGSNWTTSHSVCDWIGVTCGARHQRVVALNLSDMGLTGTVSSHLGNLSFLGFLDISKNNFSGNLPEETYRLGRLSFIDVSFNGFNGNIPSWFGLLPRLKYVNLQNNSFTGPIPLSLSNCSKLELLDTTFNQLNGMIPKELGNLQHLKHFQMGKNQLEGEIPRSMFNISSLETFELTRNRISGGLPLDMCSGLPNLKIFTVAENELKGRIPSSLQFCSRLEVLSLSYNKFHGPIPSAFGNMSTLNILSLGGNNLEGDIPSELARLAKLKMLGLEHAGLGGSIPPIFRNISNLEYLQISNNRLTGSIPNELGNCTSMKELYIADNHLTGQFPECIGSLHKLEALGLDLNNLGGHVPATFFNITSLRTISLVDNHFMGHLPPTFGLPNLEGLYLGINQFSGTIPASISNSSRLTILSLGLNNFTGSPPTTFGNLRFLEWLDIGANNLKINGGTFISSLNGCKSLHQLVMNFNQINGPLPSSFGNLTSSLQIFRADSCRIMGMIPQDIANMSKLQALDLASNELVGSLPHMFQHLPNLERFHAFDNNISGSIPDDICHLPRLGGLSLHTNKFSGPLPDCVGNITTLRYLYLNDNQLSSKIPASVWSLKDILGLVLSSNSFTGYLPPDIGNLRAAIYINISMNQLSGTVPSPIGSLQTLAGLYLAHNKFEGSIPESFGKLLSMEEFDLSYNNLSGEIPKSLEALSHLKIFNLSFNQLSREIPSGGAFKNLTYLSFESNKALCGSPQFHVPRCQSGGSSKHLTKRGKVLLIVFVLTGMALLMLVGLATLYVMLKYRKKHRIPLVEDLQPAVTQERISYHEILQATSSFDDSNLLGKGSFGSVYKGVFTNGRTWAVKVFHLQVERAIRSFDTECEMLRNIRHRNLTKVISSCTNLDFMALVLEYMPNGSLDKWLYSHNYILDAKKRLDIVIDVASALDYLHHGYSVPVVHCDLKPSNVLLDEDMVAYVSDFGISKFLKKEGTIAQTTTLATIGYTAPEYGREGLVSTKCDVYSFGIMLMEVFTRKRPTEEMFKENLDLKLWVMQSLPDRVMQVIDGNLLREKDHQDDALVQCVSAIFELALNCSADSPDERTNMKDVHASLKKIKLRFLSNGTSS